MDTFGIVFLYATGTAICFIGGCLILEAVANPRHPDHKDRRRVAQLTLAAPLWPIGAVYLAISYMARLVRCAL